MDNHTNNSSKAHVSFSEASNSKDSSASDNQWADNRRDHTKKDRGREVEFIAERPSFNKCEHDKDDKAHKEEPTVQQSGNFPSYNYNSADHLFVDNSRHTLSMMSYNMMATVNTPWPVNSYENMAVNQHNVTVSQPAMPMATGLDMVQPSTSSMNPYAFMGIPGENVFNVVGNYCQYGGVPTQGNMFFPPVKQVVHLTNCVLYPPSPNGPIPTTKERPAGCKTVFVGGLPEKITEEIIKEVFERCGNVETIRMSKKNFCHIRFSEEVFVDNAIYFTGYRLKIENKDEAPFAGRIHVDFASARDDQYDYECKQRALQRQADREQDYYRAPTPPVVHYTDHKASLIPEKLRNEETFMQAASILINWLEKGECTKKNASSFFSMIQSTHNHVRKLQVDKVKYEEQLNEAKKMLKKQLEGIIRQFTEIGKIYKAASLQKCWNHFTKSQRKNIEIWRKQTEELKNAHMEEVINEREDEEMELSDEENKNGKKDTDVEQLRCQYKEHIQKLQEEGNLLKCQLEAAQNEKIVQQSDHQDESKHKDNQLSAMQTALQNSKKEVLNQSQKLAKEEAELKELKELCAFKSRMNGERNEDYDLSHDSNDAGASSSAIILENDARLIGLTSTFLNVHPFGANIDYICSFLHQIDTSTRTRDVENLMKRFPTVYKEESSGIGASLGKKWRFIGFQVPDRSTI